MPKGRAGSYPEVRAHEGLDVQDIHAAHGIGEAGLQGAGGMGGRLAAGHPVHYEHMAVALGLCPAMETMKVSGSPGRCQLPLSHTAGHVLRAKVQGSGAGRQQPA